MTVTPATPTELDPVARRSIVAAFAADLADAYTIAKALSGTSFVPKEFRGKPEETAAAILTGAELGLSPMGALRAIHVITGKPALSAAVMRAVVQAHGHDIWVQESSPERVVVSGRRRGSEHVQTAEWTIQRAKTAGLTGKDSWRNHPEAMLIARATAQVARLVAADLLHGVYTEEEAEAEAGQVPKRGPVRRARREPPVPEPPVLDAPVVPDPAPAPVVVDEPEFDEGHQSVAPLTGGEVR